MLHNFLYAFNGIKIFFSKETSALILSSIALVVIGAGFFFKINLTEWYLIIFSIGMVLTAEMFNTAFEILVDKISPEKNETAGKIKDMAAGAVLISVFAAGVIGLIIFAPKVYALFL